MWLLLLALVVGALKLLAQLGYVEWAALGRMSWWWVGALFGLTVAWWAYADYSGLTRRKAAEREARRVQARVDRTRQSMGLRPRKPR